MDREQALFILKKCLPGAEDVRIVREHVETGQRHVSSDVTRFVVEYKQNDSTRRVHLIIKVPTTKPIFSAFDENHLYEKEVGAYERVIPWLNQYLDKSLTPAHYHTTDSRILVLEDLTARGYTSGENLAALDLSQIRCAVKALAGFHAASHKLHAEDPNILKNLLDFYLSAKVLGQVVSTWGSVALELLRRDDESHLIPRVEAGISFFQKEEAEILAIFHQSNYKFVVLNHGDFRKENLLFKCSLNNQVQVQFIDFQTSIWSSPAFDLLYFLTTSVSADLLEGHFDELVDEYLGELNTKLGKLNCSSTYERKDFDEDFKMLKYMLFFNFSCLCGLVSPLNSQEVSESFSKSNADDSNLREVCLKDERFVHVIRGWLKYFEKSTIFDEF